MPRRNRSSYRSRSPTLPPEYLDPVQALCEMCTKLRCLPPVYEDEDEEDLAHGMRYTIGCYIHDLVEIGVGEDKESAKKLAAVNMMSRLQRTYDAAEDLLILDACISAFKSAPVLTIPSNLDEVREDPVKTLRELCSERGWLAPFYTNEGNQDFPTGSVIVARCYANNLEEIGMAKNLSTAEKVAAMNMLRKIRYQELSETENIENNCFRSPGHLSFNEPVQALDEICIKQRWPEPEYTSTVSTIAPARKSVLIKCYANNMESKGTGESEKIARKSAAHNMLDLMKRHEQNYSEDFEITGAYASACSRQSDFHTSVPESYSDPLQDLEEHCRKLGCLQPFYTIEREIKIPEEREYIIHCYVVSFVTVGNARSKSAARKSAAEAMLNLLCKKKKISETLEVIREPA